MNGGKNKFIEDLEECISKSLFNYGNTEANASAFNKHDIIAVIDKSNLKLNKKSKKRTKKENLKKYGITYLLKKKYKKIKKNNKKPKIQYHSTPIKNKSIFHENNNNKITSNHVKQKIFLITKMPKKKKYSQNKKILETNNNINNSNKNIKDICKLSNNSINVNNSNFINSSMNFIYNNNFNNNLEQFELNFIRKKRKCEEMFDIYEKCRKMEEKLNNIYNSPFK